MLLIPFFGISQKACNVFGKVKFVEYGEDYKVKFVDYGEDYKLKVVKFGEDFKAKEVDYDEGCN